MTGPDEQLWQSVVSDWDNQKLHDALLSQCQSAAQLAALAGRYRSLLDDAARKGGAESQLKRIAAAAMAQMEVSSATRRQEPGRGFSWKLLVVVLFVLGTVALLRFL